jgi:hypothetical protein
MIVVAGPPGSGKTRYFPVTAFGVDAFNIDDRCAQILGSYRALPRDVRRACTEASSRAGVGLLPAPPGSCECGAFASSLASHPRPSR